MERRKRIRCKDKNGKLVIGGGIDSTKGHEGDK